MVKPRDTAGKAEEEEEEEKKKERRVMVKPRGTAGKAEEGQRVLLLTWPDVVPPAARCLSVKRFVRVQPHQCFVTTLPGPGVLGSALGQVGPVSVNCDWVRKKV